MKYIPPNPIELEEKIDILKTALREMDHLCREVIHDHVDNPRLRRELMADAIHIFQNGTTNV